MSKRVLCFSRSGYSKLFAELPNGRIDVDHLVVNKQEKKSVEKRGGEVIGCFEEEYDSLNGKECKTGYLLNGLQPDRFYSEFGLDERREILGKEIAFIGPKLEKKRYNAVVHETISIELEEVLSLEAKLRGIPDLSLLPSPAEGYFFWKKSPYNSSIPKKDLKKRRLSDKLFNDSREHIKGIREGGHYPSYLGQFSLRDWFKSGVAEGYKKASLMWDAYKEGRLNKLKKYESLFYYSGGHSVDSEIPSRLIREFSGVYSGINDVVGSKYVFYPLHVEPEATLRYFSPIFSNQEAVLDAIARFLPTDTHLVVKEHPNQPGALSAPKFRRLKRKNSSVKYLPASIPSEQVLTEAEKVITIAGTVGWEALVYEKPVFVFGNVFYDKHPSVYNINSLKDLRGVLRMDEVRCPTYEETVEYFARVLGVAHEGSLSRSAWGNVDNMNKVERSIVDEIEYRVE